MKKTNVTIYMDSREMSSKIYPILLKRCKVEEAQLPVADYLLSKRVAVERKTSSDFVQSIIDGRLFKQLAEMKDNFARPVMIIEGNPMEEERIHPNALRGALASIVTDYSVPVIRTENQLETAELLLAIAKREQLEKNRKNAVRGKKKARSMNEIQEYMLSGLPKISRQKARNLLKHFETPQNIFMASEEELLKVKGIGKKLAKDVRRILAKKYEKSVLED